MSISGPQMKNQRMFRLTRSSSGPKTTGRLDLGLRDSDRLRESLFLPGA
jgi:hypothetical protein